MNIEDNTEWWEKETITYAWVYRSRYSLRYVQHSCIFNLHILSILYFWCWCKMFDDRKSILKYLEMQFKEKTRFYSILILKLILIALTVSRLKYLTPCSLCYDLRYCSKALKVLESRHQQTNSLKKFSNYRFIVSLLLINRQGTYTQTQNKGKTKLLKMFYDSSPMKNLKCFLQWYNAYLSLKLR